jgi:hypothetical protein
VRFAAVAIEEAELLARAAERQLAELVRSFAPAPPSGDVDLGPLYTANLISGVIEGVG